MKTRIGFGFDVHKLVEGRELWLGGIRIEHTLGLLGHSDADVLIHALCDALLGAANMRDIGFHFPDTANEYKNIDSKILLKKTVELIREKGFSIGNADITNTLNSTLIFLSCKKHFQNVWASILKIYPLKPLLPKN